MDLKLIRKLNPIFSKINNQKLIYFLSYNLKDKKKQYELILNINDFNLKYPDFDINYYILFNTDLYKNFSNIFDIYSHYINHGINENRIINQDTFLKKYNEFNFDFFKEINNELIKKNIEFLDLDKIKFNLDLKLKIIKIYFDEKNKENSEYILDLGDFEKKYPNFNSGIVYLFNQKFVESDNNIDIIKFYLGNKDKNSNIINYVLSKEDFSKKYENFSYNFFIKYHNLDYDELEAMVYYHNNIIENNDLICNKNEIILIDYEKEIKEENFDWKFYVDFYPDLKKLGIDNEKISYIHYKEYGKKEGRKCNKNNLLNSCNNSLNLIKNDDSIDIDEKPEFLINILIKSSKYNNYLSKCVESILEQNYNNYRILIGFNNDKNILKNYNDNRLEYYYNESNKYNLLKYVKKGWVILLDDNLKFVDINVLKFLNNLIEIKSNIYNLNENDVCENLTDNYNLFYFKNNFDENIDYEKYIKNYLNIENENIINIDKILLSKIRKNICIFHCGNIEIFSEIINTFPEIKEYNLIITFYNDNYHNILENLNLSIIKLIKVENKGCDCGPMLLSIDFLLKNKHLYDKTTKFIKIHTKSIKDWRNKLIKEIITFDDKNYIECEKPIIFGNDEYIFPNNKGVNREYSDEIFHRSNINKYINIDDYYDIYYFDKVSDNNLNNIYVDLIPSLEFYKNYEPDLKNEKTLEHWYLHGINEYHRKSNVNYIKEYAKYKNYFIAGTIFGFNKNYLDLFINIDLEYEYSILEEGYKTNINVSKLHAWEYFFSQIVVINNGLIIGNENNKIKIYNTELYEKKIKYSIINIPFKKSQICIFMLPPTDNPDSGGYRSLLKYINYLNRKGYSLDIYFGIAWNDDEISYNVDDINQYGMPTCKNWLQENDYDIIYKLVNNIKQYNILDIDANNFYLGLRCQKKYKILIANAWQTAGAVYKNKEYADNLYYIIQDREELFYPEDDFLKQNVLKTYQPEYNYYFITQYLGNYFQDTYNFENIYSSYMGVNLNIYKNLNIKREKSVIIPYYQDKKPGRKPELVEKIIKILSDNKIKCYIYPYDFNLEDENIINLGTLKEEELNELYNKSNVGIIFSNTNPSRLGFEMYASGLHVIEYDSEFTKYDMPDKYFTKIKDENNILEIVNNLFNKKYDDGFLKNIDINTDFKNFLKFIN